MWFEFHACLFFLDALGTWDHRMVHVWIPVHSGTFFHTLAVMLVLLLVGAMAMTHRHSIPETAQLLCHLSFLPQRQ
jgi:hypothetical protein